MGKWAQGKDIIGSRKWFYMLSLAVIVPGLLFLCAGQLKRGVDFTGGNEWIIASQQRVTDREVTKALTEAGIARSHYDMQIGRDLRSGDIQVTVHSKPNEVPQSIQPKVLANLQALGVKDARTVENEMVEPLIGREQEQNAFLAVVIASILIVLYLSFRFAQGGFKEGLKYGVCAVIAMLHDVFVVVGLFAIFGFFMGIEVDMTFVTAVLTIIGFSVHDTIVIFDRVRENLRKRSRDETFDHVYNRSIIQTAARSINTSFTVILVLMALVLFGAPVIRWFNIALLIGIISGTYSSIFNASPLVVDWQHIKRRRELALRTASKTAAATTMKSSATQVKSGAAPARPSTGSATLRERGGFGSRPANSTSPGTEPSDITPEASAEAATPGEVGADAGGWPDRSRQGSGQPARARPSSGRVSPRRKQRH
jgi:preprotein translocase SecF subunit